MDIVMGDRHAFRADWLDYNEGIFFVTICAYHKRHLFGRVENGQMFLNKLGQTVNYMVEQIPLHHKDAEIHNHIVMPNHVHILIQLTGEYRLSSKEITNIGCLKPPRHGKQREHNHFNSRLAVVIGSFKAAVTHHHRLETSSRDIEIWQIKFHDHEVKNHHSYQMIDQYISSNPENWENDCFNASL